MFDELCYRCDYYWMNNPQDTEGSCHGDPMIHGCVPEEWLCPMTINFSNEKVITAPFRKSIFLAGPTLRGSTFDKSWRKEACEMLEKLGFNGVVYVPEKENEVSYDFFEQAEWEREALMSADIILFYIPRKLPELPGFTTNVEFGMWLSKRPNAVVFCSPDGAEKNRYLEWLYLKEKPNATIYKDLEEALKNCI